MSSQQVATQPKQVQVTNKIGLTLCVYQQLYIYIYLVMSFIRVS